MDRRLESEKNCLGNSAAVLHYSERSHAYTFCYPYSSIAFFGYLAQNLPGKSGRYWAICWMAEELSWP